MVLESNRAYLAASSAAAMATAAKMSVVQHQRRAAASAARANREPRRVPVGQRRLGPGFLERYNQQ